MFEASKFTKDGAYLMYEGKFVARFKYRGAPITMSMFKKFLIKNMTPEAYFTALDAGATPLAIARANGMKG